MSEDPVAGALAVIVDVIRDLSERVKRLEEALETPFEPARIAPVRPALWDPVSFGGDARMYDEFTRLTEPRSLKAPSD